MNNPEIYIFVALGFAFALSWIASRFSHLSIDLFNTSIGLLFGASANLALMANPTYGMGLEENMPALLDYAILLIFLQFAFGILVISSHLAHKNLNESYVDETHVKLREAIFYSCSSVTSLFSCYVMAIFFLHARVIFSPTVSPQGELETIIQRWLDQSYVPMYFWVILLLVLVFVRFWREQIGSLAKP